MNNKGFIKEVLVMTLADAITAIAVYFFLVPSHTSISSISGLGIVLTHFIPLPLSVITMAFNVILLIIGFILCGKEFGAKTVYTSVMLPVFLGILRRSSQISPLSPGARNWMLSVTSSSSASGLRCSLT